LLRKLRECTGTSTQLRLARCCDCRAQRTSDSSPAAAVVALSGSGPIRTRDGLSHRESHPGRQEGMKGSGWIGSSARLTRLVSRLRRFQAAALQCCSTSPKTDRDCDHAVTGPRGTERLNSTLRALARDNLVHAIMPMPIGRFFFPNVFLFPSRGMSKP
jgi:hypothetical protein